MLLALPSAISTEKFLIAEAHRCQVTTPDTTGIQRKDIRSISAALECGPMSENDLVVAGFALGMAEPGEVAIVFGFRTALGHQIQRAVSPTEAHAGEIVGDGAQALDAEQVIAPAVWLVAVHAIEVGFGHGIVSQRPMYLAGEFYCFCDAPYGWDTCMDHGKALLVYHQRQALQPFQQCICVLGTQDFRQVVLFVGKTLGAVG